MVECNFCDKKVGLPFVCEYCGLKFCANCRLPERHKCTNFDRLTAIPVTKKL